MKKKLVALAAHGALAVLPGAIALLANYLSTRNVAGISGLTAIMVVRQVDHTVVTPYLQRLEDAPTPVVTEAAPTVAADPVDPTLPAASDAVTSPEAPAA